DCENSQLERIEKSGSVETQNPRGNIYCLTIIGQVEGHTLLPPQNKSTKYEHVLPQLVSVEENPDIDGMLVILNTAGGDVEAGLAMAEMIAGMRKPTVSLVLGGGHSIGVPLAVATDYSIIAPSATMTVHPLRVSGLVIGVIQTFDNMQKIQDRILNFITAHSSIDYNSLKKLMLATDEIANDVGTILFGENAVKHGIIDSVGGLGDALEKLYSMIEKQKKEKE
ncbi:MAG: ATP-dependent Clp protease proteolytic subunit, partial [Oscillospiraceae bacterium]|nr:ATP-dependent Clp protease proteolytic subunit [Oscillospiraceae bacterium]